MAEGQLVANISLIGFGNLEPSELKVTDNIVNTYLKKLSDRANIITLKIRLRQHEHGKSFIHEITVDVTATKHGDEGKQVKLTAYSNGRNLLSALSESFEKILSEIDHWKRSPKDKGQEILRKQKKEIRKQKSAED